TNIKRRSRNVWRGMWWRGIRTEKQLRNQAKTWQTSHIRSAKINCSPRNQERVTRNVAVATVKSGTIVEIGNNNDIGFVISRAGFYPTLPLTHVVGRSQVCVSVASTDLKATELV